MSKSHHQADSTFKPTKPHAGISLMAHLALVFTLVGALVASAPVALAVASGPNCTTEQGQAFIDEGRYEQAIREFACVIEAQPTEVEGYRGRIEAELLLSQYSDAVRDYSRVTAFVLPAHPDAEATIVDGYDARLATAPNDIPALTGASFARWWFFALSPTSPDVRYIVADAYTYGLPDTERAFAEATLALDWGLDTPRVHAILASAYNAFGDLEAAAGHIQRHIELVTTELITTPALPEGDSLALDLVPGRTYDIPVGATAGQTISITTSSRDFWDSIAVLLAPDGSPAVGSDDDSAYFAAFDWIAPATGVYRLRVTSFESVSTGELVVSRD